MARPTVRLPYLYQPTCTQCPTNHRQPCSLQQYTSRPEMLFESTFSSSDETYWNQSQSVSYTDMTWVCMQNIATTPCRGKWDYWVLRQPAIDELCVCRGQPKDETRINWKKYEEDNYGTQLLQGSSDISVISWGKKMKTWRSASSQGWQKVLVEEEDREERGVMTSRNGHSCQQKRHCSWPGTVQLGEALSIMPPTFVPANKAPTTTTISDLLPSVRWHCWLGSKPRTSWAFNVKNPLGFIVLLLW